MMTSTTTTTTTTSPSCSDMTYNPLKTTSPCGSLTTYDKKEWGALLLRSGGSTHTASTVCSIEDDDDDDSSIVSEVEVKVLPYEKAEEDDTTPKERRRVAFASAAELYFIDSHKTYSKEERRNCWYSRQEKERTMAQIDRIATRMDLGQPAKSDEPYRGLHVWTVDGGKALERQIRRTVDAVVDEQEEKWYTGFDADTEAMARASQRVTAMSVQKAIYVAQQDEKDAIAILFQTQ